MHVVKRQIERHQKKHLIEAALQDSRLDQMLRIAVKETGKKKGNEKKRTDGPKNLNAEATDRTHRKA